MGRTRTTPHCIIAIALGAAACVPLAGVGATAVVVGAAVVAHRCYDTIDVKVLDAATGLPLCDASVTVVSKDDRYELMPCFVGHLTEGKWGIVAEHAGYTSEATALTVQRGAKCEPAIQTIELRLEPVAVPGSYVAPPVPEYSTSPGPPAPLPPPAQPTTAPPESPPAAPTGEAQPAPAPAPAPADPPTPPVERFPDAPKR